MRVRLIVSPYDSGQKLRRMGCGPDRLLDEGLAAALEADGSNVEVRRIELTEAFPSEIAVGFAAMRAVSMQVAAALRDRALPVVLAGNCNTTVGAVAGLGAERSGVLWLDAHGDINTPDSSESGFLDGMGVAVLTGRAWTRLAQSVPGFTPLPDARLILAGVRDLDPDEKALLTRSAISVVNDATIRKAGAEAALGPVLTELSKRIGSLHLHLDLDVHDAAVAPANHFRPLGGLTPAEVGAVIEATVARLPLGSLAVTAYDPSVDPSGITAAAAIDHVRRAVSGAAEQRRARRSA
ncbi:arginase family protein [Algihabitans sp.]|uniref:arginase family protein n=1 Tax=Algihabitans sp. TaxID=2821514 RepID=UPI003BAC8B31